MSVGTGNIQSESTFVNLLMYDSTSMSKHNHKTNSNHHQHIEEDSNESMPTYYHDNTQDN